MRQHLACLPIVAVGFLLGWSAVAWSQETSAAAALALDPVTIGLLELVKGGGLPAVLALLGWWLRGVSVQGIPLIIRLHDDDRRALEALRAPRHENHHDPA